MDESNFFIDPVLRSFSNMIEEPNLSLADVVNIGDGVYELKLTASCSCVECDFMMLCSAIATWDVPLKVIIPEFKAEGRVLFSAKGSCGKRCY